MTEKYSNIGLFLVFFSLNAIFSISALAQSSETPPAGSVKFQSSDSTVVNFKNGRTAVLFGNAKVTHEAGELTSGKIDLNLNTTTVSALSRSKTDTLSFPVLMRDGQEIRSNRILFNYETQKGKFEAATINVADGQLIGSQVKNVSQEEVFIQDGIYSTCPPDYLYYYIKAKKMKVVDQEEIFFTNARLYILDIPYPLVFPFGYVPADIEKKKSGLLTPTYAFEAQSSRGIGLQNLGWFEYFNDYITAEFATDLYTSGTFFANLNTQYRKTNFYNGSVRLGYSKERGLETSDPDFGTSVQRSISLTHNQELSPYANISANINLRTADYFLRNSYDIEDRATTNSSSSLNYSYRQPDNLYSFSISSQLAQNFNQNSTNLRGPRATFSLKTISPFKSNNATASGNPSWYESISLRYSNNLDSRFDYSPIDGDSADIGFMEALFSPSAYEEATGKDTYIQAGLQQNFGLQIGKLLNSQFINLSASTNYTEYWYPSSTRRFFIPEENRVETVKENGFVTARDFNAGLSFSTTIYGVSNLNIGKLNGFRHTLRPTIGYSVRPDFGDPIWGYYRTVQTDTLGNTQRYSIFQNEVFGGPSAGEQQSITFSLNNVFETKLVKRDTTGEVSENTLKLVDNLSFNTSYNFAADSLKLNQLSSSISSSAVRGLSLRGGATFSFYEVDSLGRAFDQFLFTGGEKLAQLQNFNLSASTSFRGGRNGVEVFTPVYRQVYDPFNQARFSAIDPYFNEEEVMPVKSPWSVSFNFNYSWTYRFNQDPLKRATLNAQNISFQLTPKWRFATTLGYDFVQKELTPSQFNLSRDLECWNLSFQISPFGEFQYYFFRLTLNNAQIQSIFQKLPVLKNLERSSNPTGRRF